MTPKHRMFVSKHREMLGCGEIGKRISELFINHDKNVKNKYWSDVRMSSSSGNVIRS
jgi:predicted dinucleotide-utilizing enzyme